MSKKIALIFDFDITMSPYYQQKKLIEHWNIDESEFWKRCTKKVTDEEYDLEHGYIKVITEYIAEQSLSLSNNDLFNLGRSISLYDGLSRRESKKNIFDDMLDIVNSKTYGDLNVELECYCISGGLTEMINGAIESHELTPFFKKIYACRLVENSDGNIAFPKETVGHTIKTQKIFQIAKGLEKDVNEVVDGYEIPFEHMIFVGDGLTDVPAFSLVQKMGGTSIAVYRESKNGDGSVNPEQTFKNYEAGYELAIKSKRAEQLLPADYSEGKPLKMALLYHVDRICKHIAHKNEAALS
ncbi:HAD family hydrolase [Sulfurovum sp. NBC37-1]|uniref:HAD family hydrolase n=1 Tax=Sulfurovum sp. (strain NBC37-1) TaxID=387093 RepID=UPI0001587988|nr:HAD family hydrolase [Sulfurovum sp. NBC37-1]BAF73247.1 conserved hypothetical protein [Sulfurovum sp. NBC37-1]